MPARKTGKRSTDLFLTEGESFTELNRGRDVIKTKRNNMHERSPHLLLCGTISRNLTADHLEFFRFGLGNRKIRIRVYSYLR